MSQQEAQLTAVSNEALWDSETKKTYTWNSYVSDYEGCCILRYLAVSSGNLLTYLLHGAESFLRS